MKTIPNLVLLLPTTVAWVCYSGELGSPPKGDSAAPISRGAGMQKLVFENHINAAALAELGVERFNYDKKNGLDCILDLTDDTEASKYCARKSTLFGLPPEG